MKYRNKKNKNIYTLIGFGKHTETNEMMAIYTVDELSVRDVWIRPYALFIEKFEPVNEL